jgi:parvulin-like peptidyl-prolyl isomerase
MIRRFSLLALALVALISTSCSTFAVAAATVNGQKISESQVESELDRVRNDPTFKELLQSQADQLRGVARRNILTGLIRQKILEQEASKRHVRVKREAVDRLISQEARRQGVSVEEFRRSQNLTEADARVIGERIVRLFELRRRVVRNVDVDNDDVRKAYEAQKEAFVEVHLLRITVRTTRDARRVLERLEDSTFSEIARRSSIDDLARKGGDMGYVPLTTLSSQAQGALNNVSDGGVTDPIPVANGFEIYRLLDKRSRDFSDVRSDLRAQLADQARERRFEQWLGHRLQSARIVVNPKYGRFDASALQVVPGERKLRP